MAFTQEPDKVPTSIPKIRIVLIDNPSETPSYKALFHLEVADQNGNTVQTYSGSLLDHYTVGQLQNLKTMMDAFRADAERQLIPERSASAQAYIAGT
jgi:hypothetical protein